MIVAEADIPAEMGRDGLVFLDFLSLALWWASQHALGRRMPLLGRECADE